jgi:hypothetical protein
VIAADLLRRGQQLAGELGGLFYFAPGSLQQASALGLNPSQWYFLGRGGALGDVHAAVVDSALGYFAPSVVATYWDSGRAIVSPREVTRAHITEQDWERLAEADDLTRKLLEPAYSALTEREGDDLLRGLTEMKPRLPVPELPE